MQYSLSMCEGLSQRGSSHPCHREDEKKDLRISLHFFYLAPSISDILILCSLGFRVTPSLTLMSPYLPLVFSDSEFRTPQFAIGMDNFLKDDTIAFSNYHYNCDGIFSGNLERSQG
jgi:hypothetical protein